MPLDAGNLDREIILQTATMSQDSVTNQEVLTFDAEDDEALWAEWLPGTATEVWKARQIDSTIEGAYRIYDRDPRPVPDINRILGHDGRTYDIRGVTEIGRGEGLIVLVVARAEAPE